MKKYLIGSAAVLSLLAFTACSDEGADADENSGGTPILDRVKDRGEVIAGVNGDLPGFGYLDSSGDYQGFDVDFARVIAAAVFGDADAVSFRPLSAQDRLTAVQTDEVDILVRNTTNTLERDAMGLHFGPTIFYDGQGIMVRADSGITSLEDLEGARIGVDTGTTTEMNLADQFRLLGIDYEPLPFDGQDQVVDSYESGSADAWTTDRSGLAARLDTLSNPDDHVILPDVISKEPLAPVVKSTDATWFDIMNWSVYATIQAEEFGIDSTNIDSFMDTEDPEIRRFLGLEGALGEQIGLENDFAVNIIKQVGNYEEIYNRHIGPETTFGLEREMNNIWTNGGLHYSPPFR
ncbi:amino acid ABC transporter substrate-binding protein [Shouchella lehensis]|uniref:Extracellular solute-binding protein family 3 n=2 Tax=Shouchella lehensis TaxID=300825 RepID=A0A060LPL8_9BACI|nr:amino acid ABC transporter substrate-binding protein [Shouchella lehensis]AIC93281.1 extracellular solute-binding protein family 3 [Shouchella lehensis G1]MBG9782956.1 amino acid ABC transporter substrate-binding protein [Shouchella lehensis]RQW22836.1 amino acid ABC transporter substrate-binding protein [Bacillus sp. C1-1]TES49689.1 amino acid ABC transporter substrate-binding protein [Shouchella lehensis]